jgi:membrane protease YdiL (CAAX protease family)
VNPTLDTLSVYLARVAPGLVLGAAILYLAPARLRIIVYLMMFVLLRDAMTPLGLWSFGTDGGFWIRLSPDPWIQLLFGVSCLGMALGLYYGDQENRPLVRWWRGRGPLGVLTALAGTVLVAAPLAALSRFVPIETRGGPVPSHLFPTILVFALLGNLMEELLFRGYVLGALGERMRPLRAGIWSGVVFAFCHIFLAISVTGVGYPLLVFTLWEGVIAGVVGARCGVLASTLTHGGAIFLLSSGLI